MAFDPVRRLTLVAAAVAAAAGLALTAGCQRPGEPTTAGAAFKAVDITGAAYARELTLPDIEGRQRSLSEFKGQLVVVFFGFAQCPDVCPTTLQELAMVREALATEGARVQGIFVTVDPERDTAEVLKAYVENYGAGFIALRGTPEATRAMAKDFKVFYSKVPGKTEGSYSIDHTAGAYVYDTQGRIRLFTRYGSGTEAVLHDLRLLLAEKP
jgi:protein SCO1/2